MAKKKKMRVSLRKNRQSRKRTTDVTRQYLDDDDPFDVSSERVRARGGLSRKRTIIVDEDADALAVGDATVRRGRVLSVQGLYGTVVTLEGESFRCYVRRLLKSLDREGRGVLAVGDWVDFKPAPDGEGLVLRVLPRKQVLLRRYRREEHIIAANVEQALIVGSLIRPALKPTLLDRYLVRAHQGGLAPVVCFNKADLVDGSQFQPLIGLYGQLGIPIILTSAVTGQGIDELRQRLAGRDTVLVGQSGVGKSSLLNALHPEYHLKVREISNLSRKGRHTTTTAQWLGFPGGGSVIDTPGVRQFELGDLSPAELPAYFPEFTPFLPRCRFPGCTHTEETDCGIVNAVVDRLIAASRYDSYRRILEGAEE